MNSVVSALSPNFTKRFLSFLFCLVFIAMWRPFKGSSYTHKYECWESAHSGSRINLSASLLSFTCCISPNFSIVMLHRLVSPSTLLSHQLSDSAPYYFDSITFSHLIFFYGSGISTHSALILVICPRMISQALSFPCWISDNHTERTTPFQLILV